MAILGGSARQTRDLFDRAITARDVRTPLAGQQQVPTAEHVERQVAVFFIVAVEEAALLLPVQRNVVRVSSGMDDAAQLTAVLRAVRASASRS